MNAAAFQALHDGCRDRVRSGILAYVRNPTLAEDVTAAAFAIAFEKRDSFRRESTFFSWVYRIALNQAYSDRRGKRTESLDALEGFTPEALIQPDILDSVLDRASCCQRLWVALKRVPMKYRHPLVDHFIRGYSTSQIAKRRRIPQGTVLSRIFYGKKLLREAWEA